MANKTRFKINVKDEKSLNKALKQFKQKSSDFGIKTEYKERSFHKTKGEKKRLKKEANLRKIQKEHNKLKKSNSSKI